MSRARRFPALGVASGALALAASAALALQHLGAAPLPGCGFESACQRALAGPFGTLPIARWPLAFVGASYFAALSVAWAMAGGGWPSSLRWLARFGGLASLVLMGLAFVGGTPCPFCLAAQFANLVFVFCSERSTGPTRAPGPERGFLLTGLIVTAGLALARQNVELERGLEDEQELADSTRRIESGVGARAFTGRHRLGPEPAAIRLVAFTDYQCEDCARIEGEAWALVQERSDVSLSIKHFPLCKDCNRRAQELGSNPHPNACWAARAAEAAGMVAGSDGFWRMHRWLFDRGGGFVEAELERGLVELGFESGPFLQAMHSPQSLAQVQADVDEGLELGIHSTPMVFLNGVELRGWRAPAALRRAVEALAASAPEVAGPEADRPPGALEKGLADWLLEPRVSLPRRAGVEAPASPLEIVLWSDYLDAGTRELDRGIRAFLEVHPEVDYSFRHFPLDSQCVSTAPNRHPGACLAALAVEAAREGAGEEGALRLHSWLMQASLPLDEGRLREGLLSCGLDSAQVMGSTAQAAAMARVTADVEAARRLGVHSIPLLYVGGRKVPRWRVEEPGLLERILDEALGQ